ncbi:hypothetical protein [Methanosarcina mazei]|uniref:Glycosyltransferase RgtA/B/C/D-like domain-containing protein n=1 Tax=Methanosarcina mazei TaxID=2209 RepID=A0A0F8GBN9_METMZ|nr:hypothetical protein [Methanosarcina mazei]KKG61856.1 hypothetical protein DU67_04005 [Methanosarcina mazei]MDY0143537.1 hypothetical protein [Bacteroidales bacterium]
MWNMYGDAASHLSNIIRIQVNGYFDNYLFYPIAHIYIVELLEITSINLILLHKLVPLIFGILQVPFMYLFAKSVLNSKYQAIFATIAVTTFVSGWYISFTPNHLSNLLLPLICFVLVKNISKKDVNWEIITIILLVLYPTFHVVPSLAIVTIISLWIFFNKIKFKDIQTNSHEFSNLKSSLLIFFVVWSLFWISSFEVWDNVIRSMYTLFLDHNTMRLNILEDQMYNAQSKGYSVMIYFIKVMGTTFIDISIAVICAPIILKKLKRDQRINKLFFLYGPLFVLLGIISIFYLSDFGFGPLRLLYYVAIICTLFVGFFIHYLIEIAQNSDNKYLAKSLVLLSILFLVSSTFLGIFSLYPSPYTLTSSYQTTKFEIYGTDWFLNHESHDVDISSGHYNPSNRVSEYLLTVKGVDIQTRIKKYQRIRYSKPIQLHFGYDLNSSMSDYYEERTYLLISKKDRLLYTDVYPEIQDIRWTESDYEKIENDTAVNKVYLNGEFDTYYITPHSDRSH